MNKQILGAFGSLLVLVMLATPVMATKPSEPTPISYFKQTYPLPPTPLPNPIEIRIMPPESSVSYIVTRSERSGIIYDYTNNEMGDALFDFTQVGKYIAMRSESRAQWMQVWHFDLEMTSITMDGGFRGILNGKAYQTPSPGPEPYTVKGVLQGFGDDFMGKKLVVEMVRGPSRSAVITGVLITQ